MQCSHTHTVLRSCSTLCMRTRLSLVQYNYFTPGWIRAGLLPMALMHPGMDHARRLTMEAQAPFPLLL
jgi:hypothetical protein